MVPTSEKKHFDELRRGKEEERKEKRTANMKRRSEEKKTLPDVSNVCPCENLIFEIEFTHLVYLGGISIVVD